MTVIESTATWQLGFQSLETEFIDEVALAVHGTVPAELAGTLYRIGPARHDWGGERNRYWLEGDGMMHAFRFEGGHVHYRNRFVETRKKRDEDAAGRRIYGELLTPLRGGPLFRIRQIATRAGNTGSTVPVVHRGELLALCEAGHPYRLDATTLETIGEDDLGAIPWSSTYIAHAKLDPMTGELWNIGFRFAPPIRVSVFRRDAYGHCEVVARHRMPLPTIAHDFALTPTRVVIAASPWVPTRFPIGLLFRSKGPLDYLRWQPELGTRILVVDRANGEARTYTAEPFLLTHTANAFDDGDGVVVDVCAYPDTTVALDLFAGWMDGQWPAVNQGRLERLHLRADGRVTRRPLADVPFDFPRVSPTAWLGEHRMVYGVSGYLGAPVTIDTQTAAVARFDHRDGEYAGEPVVVPRPGGRSEADVWVLMLVLTRGGRTELRVFDGSQPEAPPVARMTAPHLIPFDFHGAWLPAGGQTTLP